MISSLEGLPTMAKEAPSPHEVRLAPLDTNPVFHSLGEKADQGLYDNIFLRIHREFMSFDLALSVLAKSIICNTVT